MSAFGVEAALHDIARNRDQRAAFQQDPDAVLARKPLSDEERRMIRDFDLPALLAAKINPLILQGFWTITRGPQSFPEFVMRVNAIDGDDHA